MSEERLFALFLAVFVGVIVLIYLKGLYNTYSKKVADASRSAKDSVVNQSGKVKSAIESRKAEHELNRLIKLRDAGVINEEEFQRNSAKLRNILRKQLID